MMQKILCKLTTNPWKKHSRVLNDLRILQKDPIEKIRARQLQKLNHVLQQAYLKVPYYKKLFDERGLPSQIQSLEDLVKFPILTKEDIREGGLSFLNKIDKRKGVYKNTSGGSTGDPILLYQDAHYLQMSLANACLSFDWKNFSHSDSLCLIWGAERDILQGGRRGLIDNLKDYLRNRKIFNSFCLTEHLMKDIVDWLNNKKPDLILAYIDSLMEIAKYIRSKNLKLKPQKVIQSAAGTLTEEMKEFLQDVFGCPVFNHYGSREVAAIASEGFYQNNLSIFADFNYVEVVDENGNLCPKGQEGDIIVTTLENFTMPLIRYNIGDRGFWKGYEENGICNYPQLEKVSGRSSGNFKSKNGTIIQADYLVHLLYYKDWVKSFQLIQHDYDHIEIKIVKQKEVDSREIQMIEADARLPFGSECNVRIVFVDDIPKTLTGKKLYSICKVS